MTTGNLRPDGKTSYHYVTFYVIFLEILMIFDINLSLKGL